LAAGKIADEFGIGVNVEDPIHRYGDDVQLSHVTPAGKRVFIPKYQFLETHFGVTQDGTLVDAHRTFEELVDAANAAMPFRYRFDTTDQETITLVATAARDESGHTMESTPILDRRVTIPPGTRKVYEHVSLLMQSLQEQTGVRVSCCQPAVSGVPWGSNVVPFEAREEVARTAFLRLVRSVPSPSRIIRGHLVEGQPGRYFWLMRCQPGDAWCFINVLAIPNK
jgi:hypothetical protein